MATPQILRCAAPTLLQVMPVMWLPSPKIGGVSFRSSCQLLQTSQLLILQDSCPRKLQPRVVPVSVRCEQSTKGSNSVDIWLGRIAMLGFAAAITVEITTGKGLLQKHVEILIVGLQFFLMLEHGSRHLLFLYNILFCSQVGSMIDFLARNFGLTAPLPTVALALTVLVGALTAFFIFQSASKD